MGWQRAEYLEFHDHKDCVEEEIQEKVTHSG